MSMYEDALDSRPSTAGIVNFGGLVTREGQFLRVNGTMGSLHLSTGAGQFSDVFYVAQPMQVDTYAWNTPNPFNLWTRFRIVVNGVSTILSQVTGPSVIRMMRPLFLNRGDTLQVQVAASEGAAPSMLSLYMRPQ
jgi:hypothetical protein